MLTANTMEAIAPIIEQRGDRRLVAIPGSVLSTLTQGVIEKHQVISAMTEVESHTELSLDDIIKNVTQACEENFGTEQSGRESLKDAVNSISKVMRNNILLARGTVLPLIDKYTEQLTQVISDKCNRSILALNIIEDTKYTILASPQLKSVVSDQKQRTVYSDIPLVRVHQAGVSGSELLDLMKTNSKAFDEVIVEWIKASGLEGLVKQVYNDLFVGSQVSHQEDAFLLRVNPAKYEVAIIALLLCWGLVRVPQENINLPLNEYKTKMEIFSAGCAGIIAQAISRYERAAGSKNLVVQYPARERQFCYDELEKNHIIVNPEVYAKFLEMGGRPEMIFGNYLTRRDTRLSDILETAEASIKEYKTQIARAKLTAINNTLTIAQTELRNIAFDIVKSVTDASDSTVGDDVPVRYEITFTGNTHMQKASAFINSLNARHLEDYYVTVRNFVCRCFFDGSMVLGLLDRIDALDPSNEKDINELALVATVDLIVDWLINQIESDTQGISLEGYYVN